MTETKKMPFYFLYKGPVQGAFLALLAAGLHLSTISYLMGMWQSEDHSYGMLVPLAAAYMAWECRSRLAATPAIPSWAGLLPFVLGIGFFWLGELGGEYLSLNLSIWLLLVGALWCFWGWERLSHIVYPLVILVFAFPLPRFLYNNISVALQLVSSRIGAFLMQLAGVSVYREGNILDLGFTRLQVVDACSGLRYLIPLIVLGLIMAWFYKAALWKRIFVAASAIPLTVATNSLRVAVTGILYEPFGPKVADGFFHGFSGWIVFMFSFGILFGLMLLLNRLFPERKKQGQNGRKPAAKVKKSGPAQGQAPFKWTDFAKPLQFSVMAALLIATLGFSFGVEFREKVPTQRPFSEFPQQVGQWKQKPGYLDPVLLKELDLDDYLMGDWSGGQNPNQEINLFVAYYQSQQKGQSIHSPATCLPGGGWETIQSSRVSISLTDAPDFSFTARRFLLEKDGKRLVVYYWFDQRGRILTNVLGLKFYAFWDALTQQRTDGALVRISTVLQDRQDPDDADKILGSFVDDIFPVLDGFFPE